VHKISVLGGIEGLAGNDRREAFNVRGKKICGWVSDGDRIRMRVKRISDLHIHQHGGRESFSLYFF